MPGRGGRADVQSAPMSRLLLPAAISATTSRSRRRQGLRHDRARGKRGSAGGGGRPRRPPGLVAAGLVGLRPAAERQPYRVGGRQGRALGPEPARRRAARARPRRPGSAACARRAAAGGRRSRAARSWRPPSRSAVSGCPPAPRAAPAPPAAGHPDPAAGRVAQPQALGQVLPGGRQVALLQRDPAQPGQAAGDVRPRADIAQDAERFLVALARGVVLAPHPGQVAEPEQGARPRPRAARCARMTASACVAEFLAPRAGCREARPPRPWCRGRNPRSTGRPPTGPRRAPRRPGPAASSRLARVQGDLGQQVERRGGLELVARRPAQVERGQRELAGVRRAARHRDLSPPARAGPVTASGADAAPGSAKNASNHRAPSAKAPRTIHTGRIAVHSRSPVSASPRVRHSLSTSRRFAASASTRRNTFTRADHGRARSPCRARPAPRTRAPCTRAAGAELGGLARAR